MTQANSGAGKPRRLFSGAEAARVLSKSAGKPSGVVVELGGVAIDLFPLSTAQATEIFELLNRVGDVEQLMRSNNGYAIAALIAREGGALMALVKASALRSLRDEIATDQERASFEAWFAELPAVETLKTVIPRLLEASGLEALFRPPQAAVAADPSSSIPPTPSSSS